MTAYTALILGLCTTLLALAPLCGCIAILAYLERDDL